MRLSGKEKSNSGFSLIELIIVIAIMGVLVGILTPMFTKYVEKSKKAKDVYTAAQIARAVNIAFVENPEAYDAFQKWKGLSTNAPITVNGTYFSHHKVYVVAASGTQDTNKKSNCFNGGEPSFWKNPDGSGSKDGSSGFYGVVNRELGLSTTEMNSSIVPKYTKKKADGNIPEKSDKPFQDLDRWRICKSEDGILEIWVAQPDPWGGYPIYRLYPDPDDFYTR